MADRKTNEKEGSKAPLFVEYQVEMIAAQQIVSCIETQFAQSDLFIVDVKVHPGNRIEVEVDADNGLTIERCKVIHRHIEKTFDREVEDYSLTVSSPGLDEPFKVKRQYLKNIGRTVSAETLEGRKIEGILKAAGEQKLVIATRNKEIVEGKKGRIWVERDEELPIAQLKETRILISFN